MPEKPTDFESYSAGYRQAVFDLAAPVPVPEAPAKRAENSGVFFAYLIGVLIGFVIFKWSN